MRKTFLIGILFASVVTAHAQNLLLNPGFEAQQILNPNLASNWGVFTQSGNNFAGSLTTFNVRTGQRGWAFLNSSGSGAFEGLVSLNPDWFQNQYLPVSPGQVLSFGGWGRANYFSELPPQSFGQFQIEFYNGQLNGEPFFGEWGRSAKLDSQSLQPWDYTYFSTGDVAVPQGAVYAKFTFIHSPNGGNSGSYFIDDLQAVPEPSCWSLLATGLLGLELLTARCKRPSRAP